MDNTNIYHFAVDRKRIDGCIIKECLCLNGSYHAVTARNKAVVNCEECLKILKLESEGKTRQKAREIVINQE